MMYKQMKLCFILALSVIIVLTGCSGNSVNKGRQIKGKAETRRRLQSTGRREPVTIKLHTFGNEASYNWKKPLRHLKRKTLTLNRMSSC